MVGNYFVVSVWRLFSVKYHKCARLIQHRQSESPVTRMTFVFSSIFRPMNNGIYESGKSSMVCPSPIKALPEWIKNKSEFDKKRNWSKSKKIIGTKPNGC
jgi:hypothetical protein